MQNLHKTVKLYRDYMEASLDYCQKHFDLAIRMYKLWRGYMPEALELTFSKIMINAAHAAVQDRIPKQLANLFSDSKPFEVLANNPQSEFHKDEAARWLNDFFMSPSKLNIQRSIIPTLQSVNIMGTGYRMPCVRHRKLDQKGGKANGKPEWEEVITSRDVDLFQIFPCPLGGEINPMDSWASDALEWFIYQEWMTDEQIKAFSQYDGWNADEAAKCFKEAHETDSSVDGALEEKYTILSGLNYGPEGSSYRKKLNDIEGRSKKRRVAHLFTREKWCVIVQDSFLVYEGKNPMGDGILPLVKYATTPDMKEWFGIGAIEMLEDLYITQALNTNFRFDYLAKAMFPAKWIRDDIMAGRPESDFYDRPYAVHGFPMHARIQEAVWVDRMPEINQQTFLEDDRLQAMMQEIGGLPNYQRGLSNSAPSNDTASGIISLIQQAQGRLGMESMNLEWDGLAQEGRLILNLASKYITEATAVRETGEDGWDWTMIDPIVFEGDYTVITHGTRFIEQKEQQFQKILAFYPNLMNDPGVDQAELKRQTLAKMGVYDSPEKLVLPPNPGGQLMPGEPTAVGGMASPMDIRNRMDSVANRSEPEPAGMVGI